MERPSKRPRLSIFRGSPSGADLDTARHDNDLTLKSRFESIFAKYSQDFTDIGDEIDLMNGKILVNNGHLESMETETDPGISQYVGDFTATGRSMLRAMSVAVHPDSSGPDDVLMSIEAIAENATFTDRLRSGSEDDLFDALPASDSSRFTSTTDEFEEGHLAESIRPYDSDSDSLFGEGGHQRSSSEDFLFRSDDYEQSIDRQTTQMSSIFSETESLPTLPVDDDDHIIARFGPHIGKEVLHLIGQRQDAHIEPAWRIPVKLDTMPIRQTSPQLTRRSSYYDSPESENETSLWNLPELKRKRLSERRGRIQNTREESVDPLQEDTTNESHISQYTIPDIDDTESDMECEYEENEPIRKLRKQTLTTGICPYCGASFAHKPGVLAHWDRCLRHAQKNPKDDDPHDYAVLGQIRSTKPLRRRGARLVVYDFRTMVELHEGAGMTFDEIMESKTLRTRKTGLQLQDVYSRHRKLDDCNDFSSNNPPWSQSEDERLEEMCKNPLATISTLRRGLKGRNELQIGNRLAEVWLAQLHEDSAQIGGSSNYTGLYNPSCATVGEPHLAAIRTMAQDTPALIKRESDDELFGGRSQSSRA